MQTREIAHEHWSHFFRDFTLLHQGEHVNVETLARECFSVEPRVHDVPLVGIVGTPAPSGSDEWIELITGDSPDAKSNHRVARPFRVLIAREHNQDIALQIESAGGLVTMVRFEPPREGMPVGFTIE